MNQINYTQNRARRGSVLLIVMGTIVVIGITLAAVLSLTVQEQRVLARTSAWNSALPTAEAGIEEAMAHLQEVGTGNRAGNGWQATYSESGTIYVMSRELSDSRYTVALTSSNAPIIRSTGEFWCPSAERYIARTVLVTTRMQAGGSGGINARGVVIFSGSGILDSFDSSEGPYDVSRRRANGVAISNLKTAGAIRVGTGKIYGKATTGPGGTVTYGVGGAVGDQGWIAGGNVGGQAGAIGSDANVEYPVPTEPFPYGTGLTPPPGGVISGYGSTNWLYALGDGNYNATGVNILSSLNPMLVTGNATLYVSGTFNVGGSGYVYLAPGASLRIYVGGTFAVSGGGIINGTGLAQNLSVFGLSTTAGRNWGYSGSANFIGTVNAPVINMFTLSGTAAGIGAFTGNNFTLSGSGGIHYDESLSAMGAPRIVSWLEL